MEAELGELRKGSAKAKELEAELAEARKDGLRYAAKHGASAEEQIKAFIADTTPEKQLASFADQLKTVEERSAKKAEEAIAADRAARAKADDAARATNVQRAEAAQVETFVRVVTELKEGETTKTPYLLAEFSPVEIAEQARLIQQFSKTVDNPAGGKGVAYSFEEVRDYPEQRAKRVHDERTERRARLIVKADDTGPGGANGVAPRKGASATEPTAGNGRRQAGPESRKDPPVKLTRLQQLQQERDEDLAKLRAAAAKDAATRK